MTKYIPITIRYANSVFSDGMRQHMWFLVMQIVKLGYVPVIVGDSKNTINEAKKQMQFDTILYRHLGEMKEFIHNNYTNISCFIFFELNNLPHNIQLLLQKYNIKSIQFCCGHNYSGWLQNFISNQNTHITKINTDLVVQFPQHKQNISILTQRNPNIPCIYIPYIWSPHFINTQNCNYTTKKFKHIHICEPNLNYIKTSFVPIISIISLWNKSPQLFQNVTININGSLKIKNSVLSLIRNISMQPDIFIQKHIKINGRLSIKDSIVKKQENEPSIILSHQNTNELNYLYFDCLVNKIPLIHNSSMIGECGYLYNHNDVHTITKHLTSLLQHGVEYHIQQTIQQQKHIETLLNTLDPFNEDTLHYMKDLFSKVEQNTISDIYEYTNFDTQQLRNIHFEVIHCVENKDRIGPLQLNLQEVKQYLKDEMNINMTWNIMMEHRHPSHAVIGCTTNHLKSMNNIIQSWSNNTLYGILEDDNVFNLSKLHHLKYTIRWLWENRYNSKWLIWNSNTACVDQQPEYKCGYIQNNSKPTLFDSDNNTSIIRMDGYSNNCLIFRPVKHQLRMIHQLITKIFNQRVTELKHNKLKSKYSLLSDFMIRVNYANKMITTLPYICFQRPGFSSIERHNIDYKNLYRRNEEWIRNNLV